MRQQAGVRIDISGKSEADLCYSACTFFLYVCSETELRLLSNSSGGGGDVWMMQAQQNGRWGWQCWAVVDGVISASAVFQGLRLGQQIMWRLWKSGVDMWREHMKVLHV